MNDRGEFVGVNVAGGGGENQGYAISLATVKRDLPALVDGESTAWLGLSAFTDSDAEGVQLETTSVVVDDDDEVKETDNTDLEGGMALSSVTRDTSVDQQTELAGGLRFASKNDRLILVTKVNGQPVPNQQEYLNAVKGIRSGEPVTLEWLGVTFTDDANLGPFTEQFSAP